jgi:hypothetical protein
MPDILRFDETLSPDESEKIVKLLLLESGDEHGKPRTAEELLQIGRDAFEPLFHQPPIGPIPEYLRPHASIHGCVTEYEEKLEELERWKAGELNLWLKDKIGLKWRAGENVYELNFETEEPGTPERYWFRLLEDKS